MVTFLTMAKEELLVLEWRERIAAIWIYRRTDWRGVRWLVDASQFMQNRDTHKLAIDEMCVAVAGGGTR